MRLFWPICLVLLFLRNCYMIFTKSKLLSNRNCERTEVIWRYNNVICKRSTRRKTRNRAALQSITKFMMSTKSMSRERGIARICMYVCMYVWVCVRKRERENLSACIWSILSLRFLTLIVHGRDSTTTV